MKCVVFKEPLHLSRKQLFASSCGIAGRLTVQADTNFPVP